MTAAGHAVAQRALPVDGLRRADEVFLTTSGGGVNPVALLDDPRFTEAVR